MEAVFSGYTQGSWIHHFYLLNRTSDFILSVSSILIRGGHGLLKSAPASCRVASILSFVPIAISDCYMVQHTRKAFREN